MDRVCGAHERDEKFVLSFNLKTQKEDTIQPRHRYENNIRMDLKKKGG
jgi:hypothetical protein